MQQSLIFISLSLYFVVQIFFTQYIYSFKYFSLTLMLGLLYLSIALLAFSKTQILIRLNLGSIICYYIITLYVIKIVYRRLNKWLINKGLINITFSAKDFTYIGWNSVIISNSPYWNKSLATSPSLLDKLLTYFLLFFPLCLVIIIQVAL